MYIYTHTHAFLLAYTPGKRLCHMLCQDQSSRLATDIFDRASKITLHTLTRLRAAKHGGIHFHTIWIVCVAPDILCTHTHTHTHTPTHPHTHTHTHTHTNNHTHTNHTQSYPPPPPSRNSLARSSSRDSISFLRFSICEKCDMQVQSVTRDMNFLKSQRPLIFLSFSKVSALLSSYPI